MATELLLLALLLYVPVLQRLFDTAPLPPQYWLVLGYPLNAGQLGVGQVR
jgi:hypothetical protein